MKFSYDALGNRVSKKVSYPHGLGQTTYYTRDAQGNIMATYSLAHDTFTLEEQIIYGSSRLGLVRQNKILSKDNHKGSGLHGPAVPAESTSGSALNKIAPSGPITPPFPTPDNKFQFSFHGLGLKSYELSGWLGNVNVVISDKKFGVDSTGDGIVDYYRADVVSATDYFPFGMQMPGRAFNSTEHRFGYNGVEKTDEISGSANHYEYKFREYDPRIGKFWSVDPLAASYPWNSTYAFAENRVIDGIDLEGLEWQPVNDQGKNVAPDADNIADYNWAGYNKFAYQNENGGISSSPLDENSIKIGIGAPEGTVSSAELWTDFSKRSYSSDQYNMKGKMVSVPALTIKVNRIVEDENQTISTFEIPQAGSFPIQGNFIEPSGPATTESNQNKRIPTGIYEDYKHWRNPPKHFGEYGVENNNVTKSRGVLMHYGKDYTWTRACLVVPDKQLIQKINNQIKSVGVENVRVIITEKF